MAFPSYTKTFHTTSYPAIDPANAALSTAGKVVFITGGGSGIGARIAHAFAKAGSTQISIYGRTRSTLLATKASIEALYPLTQVQTHTGSLTDSTALNLALSLTTQTFSRKISILISNAAHLPIPTHLSTSVPADWFAGMETNVLGNLYLLQAFLSHSVPVSDSDSQLEKPIVVHVSTGLAHVSADKMSAYSVSKLAATRLWELFAVENPGVRVVNVHPGVVETEMNRRAMEGGLVLPFDDVELSASFIVWSVSREAEFLNGKFLWANWDVDELKAKREVIESTSELTIGLIGWGV
ncbi:hypothetical protein VTL71DRAFT_1793 [Oculimacula yallundae]|uniref:NAD(P)-binding protein n=1 Tax=Oculimacula yallundae TaxID=86028 RepID=A0ABR4CBQ6_9HELO